MPKARPKRIYSKLSDMKRRVRKEFDKMAKELELAAQRDLRHLAKRHPGCKVRFISSMGTWFGSWQDKDGRWVEVQTPCCKSFQSVQEEFGWSAIPTIELELIWRLGAEEPK